MPSKNEVVLIQYRSNKKNIGENAMTIKSFKNKTLRLELFKMKYRDYALHTFVEKGLASKEELKEIHKNNPFCIEALKELHVVTALGVDAKVFSPEQKITIAELKHLDVAKLTKIIYHCHDSSEVVKFVHSTKIGS